MLPTLSAYLVASIIAGFLVWGGVRRHSPARLSIARVLLVLYVGWLLGATFFPLPLHGHVPTGDLASLNRPNLIPLRGIRETLAIPGLWPKVRLLGGNVLVFVPFGLLLPIVWPRVASFWHMALAGLLLSLGIELGQLAISLMLGYWYRMSDVDDVLLNVAGVLLGYAFSRWLMPGEAIRHGERAQPGDPRPRQ